MLSARLKALVYFTAAWFAVIAGMTFAVFEPMAGGLKIPDARLTGYGLGDFAAWAAALDDAERATFLFWHTRVLDFVFPFLLMLALFFVLRAVLSHSERYRRLPDILQVALPLFLVAPYGLFDLLENGLVADMLRGEIAINEASVGLASAYTVIKWFFLATAFVITGGLWLTARAKLRRSA